jgi:outer membrane protein TolC
LLFIDSTFNLDRSRNSVIFWIVVHTFRKFSGMGAVLALVLAVSGPSLAGNRELSAAWVAAEAPKTSPSVAARKAQIASAEAAAASAGALYVPKLTLEARYTRLSDFTSPPLFDGSQGRLVGTQAPAGAINPALTQAVDLGSTRFPVIVNNWFTQASLAVPVSDDFLRVRQVNLAASAEVDAAQAGREAAVNQSSFEAVQTYYRWVKAKSLAELAEFARENQAQHLKDAVALEKQGLAPKLDVLRAEAAFASAEVTVEESARFVRVLEQQLRLMLDVPETDTLSSAEVLSLPAAPATSEAPLAEARRARAEFAQLSAADAALEHGKAATLAARYPSLVLAANATLANPNPRRVPQSNEWFATWDASLVLRWSADEMFTAPRKAAELDARKQALAATRAELDRGLQIQLRDAETELQSARVQAAATDKQILAAAEAKRLASLAYREGKTPSIAVLDAETALLSARSKRIEVLSLAKTAEAKLCFLKGCFQQKGR